MVWARHRGPCKRPPVLGRWDQHLFYRSQMPFPNASQIASLLREFGRRAMLYGGNPYRAKAYLRAADSVAMLTEPIEELIAENKLLSIPAVGEAIAGVIATLFETGSHPTILNFPVWTA